MPSRAGQQQGSSRPARACAVCGTSLDGYRQHARHCGASCRSAARRERDQLSGRLSGWAAFLAGLAQARRRNRAKACVRRPRALSAAGEEARKAKR